MMNNLPRFTEKQIHSYNRLLKSKVSVEETPIITWRFPEVSRMMLGRYEGACRLSNRSNRITMYPHSMKSIKMKIAVTKKFSSYKG